MRTFLGLLTLVLALSSSAHAKAKPSASPKPSPAPSPTAFNPAGLAGRWSGYFLQGTTNGPMKVSFMLNLRANGKDIEGEITEDNLPSAVNPDAPARSRSTFKGTIQGQRITFVKTYDNDMHQVDYVGDIEPDGKHMAGGYNVSGIEGPFMADLVAPAK